MLALGLAVIYNGEINKMKYNKVRKILLLYKIGICYQNKVALKRTMVKDVKIVMKGGVDRLNKDIHYLIRFESIKDKNYEMFETGDRKKIKERYYEIRSALGLDIDFKKVEIEKELRNADDTNTEEFSFEEDRYLMSTRRR